MQWMQRVQDNNVKYRYLLMWGEVERAFDMLEIKCN